MDKNIHCSCRGSKFRFQHSHWSAYNYLYLQFQEIQPLLVALTCTAHIHAEKLTHMKDPPKPETNNKNFKRKKKVTPTTRDLSSGAMQHRCLAQGSTCALQC